MADKRKLQLDIERTLKRVQEGRTAFQEILDKFESSSNQTQKEKFEGDLKKEIKKLQRLRDQIKTWLTANEVKDKRPLLDARKEIEQDMERFKVIEKETKTKAYSKEGLLSTDVKKDPLQKEKEELDDWLKQCICSLNSQTEKYEFEIESLTNNCKKKRIDKETALSIAEKRQHLDNCCFHVEKLETIMRLLDNEKLDCAILRSIKEPIEFVIQSCDDPSALEYRDMYDDLRLDEIGDSSGITAAAGGAVNPVEHEMNGVPSAFTITTTSRIINDDTASLTSTHTSTSNHTDSPVTHPNSSTSSSNASTSRERRKSDEKISALGSVSASSTSTPLKSPGSTSGSGAGSGKLKSSYLANQTAPPALMSQVVAGTPHKSNRSLANQSSNGISSDASTTKNSSTIESPSSISDYVNRTHKDLKHSELFMSSHPSPDTKQVSSKDHTENPSTYLPGSVLSAPSLPVSNEVKHTSVEETGFPSIPHACLSSCISPAPDVQLSPHPIPQFTGLPSITVNNFSCPPPTTVTSVSQDRQLAALLATVRSNTTGLSDGQQPTTPYSNLDNSFIPPLSSKLLPSVTACSQPSLLPAPNTTVSSQSQTQSLMSVEKQLTSIQPLLSQVQRVSSCIQVHPLDAAAPFRNRNLEKSKGPVPSELLWQVHALENGYRRLSHPSDTEKSRMIVSKNTVNGPVYYPREPLTGSDCEEYYMKLDAQTLFFIFYYFEGTKAQYFAAKALKRMSWRFHTKYMMWFQRHEEPKEINDEFESGSYIYYDYKTMSQRKKEQFVFQYSFLEDKDF